MYQTDSMDAAITQERDLTEALGLDRAWQAIQEGFAEGVEKAKDIAIGLGDRIYVLFDDAQRVIVEQLPDGSGQTVFSGRKDSAEGGTPSASPEHKTDVGASGIGLGGLLFGAVAGYLIFRALGANDG